MLGCKRFHFCVLIGLCIGCALFVGFALSINAQEVYSAPQIRDVEAADDAPQVRCVPGIHKTWNGNPVVLKGMVRADGQRLDYRWDFGDGTAPTMGQVMSYYAISATHVYTGAPVGHSFYATLTVTDTETGVAGSDTYTVVVQERTSEVEVDVAIDDALWYLHRTMTLSEAQGIPTGYWSGYTFDVGYTGMALLAFEIQGHTLAGDIVEDPYVETVQRGINFLLTKMYTEPITVQLHGDPDRNGNGLGILCESRESEKIYEDAIAMLALASTGAPTQMAEVGPSEIIQRTYREIVQDMADWLVYAQNEEGNGRGGWRREANYVESDMSTTQWPVFALQTAEVNLGIPVPEWVRYELGDHFLRYVQSPDGGFGYSSPGVSSLLRTGAGLMGLAFAGVPDYDARVIAARRYIAEHWDTESNVGNLYAMYDVMRGSRMPAGVGAMSPQLLFYGQYDWYEAYATYLLAHQAADGSWQDEGYGQGPIGTAWGILILSPQMFIGETEPVVNLSVTKASARPLTLAEQPVTYTIVITNSGPNTATNVLLMDTLPADVLFDQDGVISSQGNCRERGTLMVPRFMCDLGELLPRATAMVTLAITPTRPVSGTMLPTWTITNTVSVAASETEATTADNIATVVVSVTVPQADLEISKGDTPDPVAIGSPLSYTLSIVNHGPDYARRIVITDILPISVTLESGPPFKRITSSQGDCGLLGTFMAPRKAFVCDLGGLGETARATVTLVVTPTAVGVVTNTAYVSAATYDPITMTNWGMQRTVIQRAASLVYLPVVMRQY